jgi:hypothetical protein
LHVAGLGTSTDEEAYCFYDDYKILINHGHYGRAASSACKTIEVFPTVVLEGARRNRRCFHCPLNDYENRQKFSFYGAECTIQEKGFDAVKSHGNKYYAWQKGK